MKNLWKVTISLLLAFSFMQAQYREIPKLSGIGMPYFEASILRMFTENGDSVKTLVYMQILNDDLTFIAKDSVFVAELEINVSVLRNNKIVESRILNQKFIEKDFSNTNSRTIKRTIKTSFFLPAGEYEFVILFRDVYTNQRLKRALKVTIPDIQRSPLSMSDVLFYSRVKYDDGKFIPEAQPNLLKNFTTDDPNIFAYFQILVGDTTRPVQIVYKMMVNEKLVEKEYKYEIKPEHRLMDLWIKIKKESLERSQYILQFELNQGKDKIKRQEIISFYWVDSPGNISSLDEAIEQLKYIIPSDTLKKYRKATFQEKKKFFERFWKGLDPDPTTTKNELMDEYYRRVNYANTHFGVMGRAGWKTDRGRIFIKFGPPDEIESYPSQMNTFPIQIWRYYSLKKEFVFVDRTGMGDYQLDPNYYSVEYTD